MKQYMTGGSFSGGITLSHMSYSTSIPINSIGVLDKYSYSYGVSSTGFSLSGGGSYTLFIGNINDEYIWRLGSNIQAEHNQKVLEYYRVHKNEENIKLYMNRFNTFVLTKEVRGKIFMYSTTGSVGFMPVPRFKLNDNGLLLYIENEV